MAKTRGVSSSPEPQPAVKAHRSRSAVFAGWHGPDLYREVYTKTLSTLFAAFIAYVIAIISGAVPFRPLVSVGAAGLLLVIGAFAALLWGGASRNIFLAGAKGVIGIFDKLGTVMVLMGVLSLAASLGIQAYRLSRGWPAGDAPGFTGWAMIVAVLGVVVTVKAGKAHARHLPLVKRPGPEPDPTTFTS